MNLLGWYFEESGSGPGQRIVLVQPGQTPDEQVEHVCETPAELWAAFEEIAADPALPEAQTQVIQEGPDDEDDDEQIEPRDIRGIAINAAEAYLTETAGSFIGGAVGRALRNPGEAANFLRSISRKDRR